MKRMLFYSKCIWYYFWGNIFSIFMFDKSYLTGKWFKGKLNGLCSPGWRWVYLSAIDRLKNNNNVNSKFPIGPFCKVSCPNNIVFDPDDLNNFQGIGNYYQAFGKIVIGKGTYIAQNVGIITANHDIYNLDRNTDAKPIIIGNNCWIGMNAMILPGVELGEHTVVGAGSVVTKSFPDGFSIIAGNPAHIIRIIDKEKMK